MKIVKCNINFNIRSIFFIAKPLIYQNCHDSLFILGIMSFVSGHSSQPGQRDRDGFVKIFDGKSLNGWEAHPLYWRGEKAIWRPHFCL